MLKSRADAGKEVLEWRKDHMWFESTSSMRIPPVVVNACCARLGIQQGEISDRGLSVFNPGGKSGNWDTLCLVLGPEKERKTDTAPLFRGKQVGLRPDLYSSYERLNPLRALLHLPPLCSDLKEFGKLCDALKGFVQSDNERDGILSAATLEALGVLCPDTLESVTITTLEVMHKRFPQHMRSLFELEFTIHKRCHCKELPPAKHVSINSMRIDCSSCPEIEPEKHILKHVVRMRDFDCFGCKHSFEIRKAPPILAVYWIPSSGKSEFFHPALHFSLKSVFDSGCRNDLDYQLVSFCSKAKANASLWSAHCKSFNDDRWKNIKDPQNIRTYGWDATCKIFTHQTHLLLFYVKTSAIPISAGNPHCFDVGRWVMAEYKRTRVFPAQIVEIIQTPNNEPTYVLSWDDGDESDRLKQAHQLRPLLDVVCKSPTYQIGDNVMAKFGFDEHYSPACIEKCFTDHSYLVSWEDGKTTYRVNTASRIRKIETPERTRRAASRTKKSACGLESPSKQQDYSEPTKEGLQASVRNEEDTARIGESTDQPGRSLTQSRGSNNFSSDQEKKRAQTSHLSGNLRTSDKQESEGPNEKNERHQQSNRRRSGRRNPGQLPLRDSSQSAPKNEGAILGVRTSDCFIFNILFTFFRIFILAHYYNCPCSSGYYIRSN